MTERAQAIAACLSLPGAYEDYPFHDANWTAMRHGANQKIFACIFERSGKIWINVKTEPQWGDFWKAAYTAVVPAYHMHKRHWISIILDGSMTEEQIFSLIKDSYELTLPKSASKNAK